uniref:Putative lipopolysaccharide-induced tumor necrosis factor-alpha factor n=1 Tax=Haematobia irritans TaxID=7368 RepID=A0A1L8EIY1_HAEIR
MDNNGMEQEVFSSNAGPRPTVITVSPNHATAFITQPVGPKSVEMTCPYCHAHIHTRVSHAATTKTHIVALLLCWTVCCCCLPYCMDSCRNANHFCPMCGAFIGTYAS